MELFTAKGERFLIDDDDYELVSGYSWYTCKGYLQARVKGSPTHKRVKLHRLIMEAEKGDIVDHINGDALDNRKCNLRIVTAQQNAFNRHNYVSHTGYKGVASGGSSGNGYRVFIGINGKRVYLGYFDNPHDAARMYNFWAHDLFGDYACLNKIEEA